MQRQSLKRKVITLFLIGFVATLPGAFENANIGHRVERETTKLLDQAKNICDSECTNYPSDWVVAEHQKDAESYCMSQCQHNMKGVRDYLLGEGFPEMFTNQYNYRVAQIYCILGLNCPQKRIIELINKYR